MGVDGISPLIIEELFAAGDARFVESIRHQHDPKKLAPIVERWKKDFRPWAREQIAAYLDRPLDCPGHDVVVKRLFKAVEEKGDDELMVAFMAAFDRLVRRVRRERWRYDWSTRQSWQEEVLWSPRDRAYVRPAHLAQNPKTLEPVRVPPRFKPGMRLFSYRTRHYLRRRVWRYFRRMAWKHPDAYPAAVARGLKLYRDEDLERGENIIDCWSLVHACFFESEVLEFTAAYPRVKDERSLSELTAAPYRPELWEKDGAAVVLMALLGEARSRLVRVWSIQLLRRHHMARLGNLGVEELLRLLDHEDAEVQAFGAEVLSRLTGLEKWPLESWLRLLSTRNLTALETITQHMEKYVTAERFSLGQMLELARAEMVPVARLGLRLLRTLPLERVIGEREGLSSLAHARSEAAAGEIAAWALSLLGREGVYDADLVSRFFDSRLRTMREAAWGWLAAQGEDGKRSAGFGDASLFSRLIESPYDDVRFHLVAELERREKLPGGPASDLGRLWAATLLAVHRGGRVKLAALRQMSKALAEDPSAAEALLPVLAVAVRSVRGPEQRHALAAVVRAAEAAPELEPVIAKHFGELQLGERVGAG